MSLQSFLEWFTQGAIVLLAILMMVQWARRRDRVSLDIFLVFGSLAILLILERALRITDIQTPWMRPLRMSVLLAHPYLLTRVVAHFRPVSRAVRRAATVGLVVSLIVTWTAAWPFRSAALVLFAFIYFISLLCYAAWAFRLGSRAARGVTHGRMQHASLGAVLLAVVFVLAMLNSALPASRAATAALTPLAALGASLNYYFAFATPAWLRRMWQSSELYGFLSERSEGVPARDDVLNRLCAFAVRAVGASSAAAAMWEQAQQALTVAVSRWGYLEPGRPVPGGALLDAWTSNQATLVKHHEWVLPGGAAGSVYVVPIPCEVGPRGLLFVLLPKAALFMADDLALLRASCHETAVQLDNVIMRDRQQALISELGERSDQLAAVNKELEAFSYSVSHDLRAPLRHISGFADLLERSPGPPFDDHRKRYLRLISESAGKMGELIDSLLVFSRMGRTEMLHTRVDLNSIVQQAQREVMEAEHGRNVEWVIEPLPTVAGDPSMLQLVFTNLLSNAFKYSRTRERAVITVGSTNGAGASESVVYVRDNGVGFDMTYADRLFGVFQRLHRAEEFEGTGIGLANVQRIVLRHGGRVWAESQLGQGATFFVALPKAADNQVGSH